MKRINLYKGLIMLILALSFSTISRAQSPIQRDTSCNFLKKLHFKDGVDTVIIKASFIDINPLVSPGYLTELNKEKGIDKKKFGYQLAFKPENCTKNYVAPSSDKNINKILKTHTAGSAIILYLTIVAFEKYHYDNEGTPYFVVIEVIAENND